VGAVFFTTPCVSGLIISALIDMHPERFRVEGFPSDPQLRAMGAKVV